MSDLTTVLTGLVFIVTQSSVKSCKLSELVAFELVLPFRNRRSSFNNVVDELLSFVDFLLGVRHNQAMKIFLLVRCVSCIRTTFSFFDGSFSTDSNFGLTFSLHFFEGIATGSNEESNY